MAWFYLADVSCPLGARAGANGCPLVCVSFERMGLVGYSRYMCCNWARSGSLKPTSWVRYSRSVS